MGEEPQLEAKQWNALCAVIANLISMNSEGKTDCQQFNTDDWGGYKRVLSSDIEHHIVRLWRGEALWNGRMDYYDNKQEDG